MYRCDSSTDSDSVSFSNYLNTEDRKMPRFCGQKNPDQTSVTSDAAFFRVTFRSNQIYESKGFKGLYTFKLGTNIDYMCYCELYLFYFDLQFIPCIDNNSIGNVFKKILMI